MTKYEAIIRFKVACYDRENDYHRKVCVESQFRRNTWEIDDENARLRISNQVAETKIFVFPTVTYANKNKFYSSSEFNITSNEYKELKDLFFGKFVPSTEYLKFIGAIE